jgi:hypothetical protein
MGILPIVDIGDTFETCRQPGSDLLRSHITIATWALAAGHVEHTVIVEVSHDGVQVVTIEGVEEAFERIESDFAWHVETPADGAG